MAYKKPSVPSVHFPAFLESMPELSGRTFVITGTTSGTGKVAAQALASKGGRVLMLNRTSERSEAIQASLGEAFPGGQVSTVECDLQSFSSVRKACDQVREQCAESGIFALINNAGIMAMPDEATEDEGTPNQNQDGDDDAELEPWPEFLRRTARIAVNKWIKNHRTMDSAMAPQEMEIGSKNNRTG